MCAGFSFFVAFWGHMGVVFSGVDCVGRSSGVVFLDA